MINADVVAVASVVDWVADGAVCNSCRRRRDQLYAGWLAVALIECANYYCQRGVRRCCLCLEDAMQEHVPVDRIVAAVAAARTAAAAVAALSMCGGHAALFDMVDILQNDE